MYDPQGSTVYSINPCPPVKYVTRIDADYLDASGNQYWDVLAHDTLVSWMFESILPDLIASIYNAERDRVFFVRQNKLGSQKLNCQVFSLPSNNSAIDLQSTKRGGRAWTGTVIEVGQRTSTAYTSRGMLWMIVRDLTENQIEEEEAE